MNAALAALVATVPGGETLTVLAEGASDGGGGFTPTNVTPGVAGFIVVFLIGAVTVLLIVDMTRRIRRMQARERVAERHRMEEESTGSDAGDGSGVRDQRGDGDAVEEADARE